MLNRREAIKKKGFAMDFSEETKEIIPFENLDFSKIKIGAQTLEDAILNLGNYRRIDARRANKVEVLKAIHNGDFLEMREISNFFYQTSGIYSRLCRYMAYLYRYDWMVTPYLDQSKKVDKKNTLNDFFKVLTYLDNFKIKKILGEISLKVIKNGCYYGYLIIQERRPVLQELPVQYCRSRFFANDIPAVEFNMKYFDDYFKDAEERKRILEIFPKEFKKGYKEYKLGHLKPQFKGDTPSWWLLDPKYAIKFNINEEDYPAFISVIPAIIDLDEAKDLDKKKMAQRLLKIIIQKMPTDKNGDLVFDIDETKEIHNNAVRMLQKAIGIDVLTTFADVDVADMEGSTTSASIDELEKVERGVYNEAGVSQMQFNTDGNIALEKSILNDEASMYNLILQYENFLNIIVEKFNKKNKKNYYKAQILTTTIYNYKEMAKLYKEQMQVGFSKMLPQIALGQSQSSILANAYFENDVLDLVHVFIPPLMSSTMNAEILNRNTGDTNNGEDSAGGRPEKADDQKSEKTIMNEESQS